VHHEVLPRGEPTIGPHGESWTLRTTRLTASQVRLGALGARTHANWILFRLPFGTTASDRVRNVRFAATATVETNVAALRIGSVCTPIRTYGPIESWALFTVGGISGTEDFADHPAPLRPI
jgi:hypothetical protein